VSTRPLEEQLGVVFHDRSLLATAFTHRSVLNEDPGRAEEDNERLEFLGDAVLGMIVAAELFRAFPNSSEGSLTNMRADLVRASSLARWARTYDLGSYLVMGRGEESRGGRDRDNLLSSTFEALIGALYLDQGLDAAREVLSPLIASALPSLAPTVPRSRDPKSELQYRSQALWGLLPTYQVLSREGPEHRPLFKVEVQVGDSLAARGEGPSKQSAEQDAARRALDSWDALAGEDPRSSTPPASPGEA
jgi:ribonuclease-3